METLSAPMVRAAGWLLLAGGIFAIVGAFCPPWRQWSAPQEEGFRAIAGNPVGWWCIHTGFLLGTVLSALGLAAYATALHGRLGGVWALLAAVGFGLAGGAWIVNLAYRLGVWNWAAQTFVTTGKTPEVFVPLQRWAGMLFGIFSLVGYGSIACLGASMLRAPLGPAWLRWTTLVCGLTLGFVVGHNVPFIMYVPFVALGVVLLRT